MKEEILSEEMRLLYVALTRAKEKLIITGYDKDYNKSISEKTKLMINDKEEKIDLVSIRQAKSYLDWIELAYINNKEELKEILEFNLINKDSIINCADSKEDVKTNKKSNLKVENKNLANKIDKILNWKYKYGQSTIIKGKSSVTEIIGENKRNIETIEKPKFLLEENEKLTKAEIGTLMHLFLQNLDFKETYNKQKIIELIEKLIDKKIITEIQANYIDINKILNFTNSTLYTDIKNAKEVFKERPFYIYISSDEIYHNGILENILVQGVIDLYYIDKNNKIVLVDYKTDYVENNNEKELIDKYKGQLGIYKKALEQSLNEKVEKVYIYSTYLNKEILIK